MLVLCKSVSHHFMAYIMLILFYFCMGDQFCSFSEKGTGLAQLPLFIPSFFILSLLFCMVVVRRFPVILVIILLISSSLPEAVAGGGGQPGHVTKYPRGRQDVSPQHYTDPFKASFFFSPKGPLSQPFQTSS